MNVSHGHACEICKRTDWCSYAEDDGQTVVAACRREVDPRYPHVTKTDRGGVVVNIHFLKGKPGEPVPEAYFRLQEPRGDHERADITTVDAVYRDVLDMLSLHEEDRFDLVRRGYDEGDIERIGFRSWPHAESRRAELLNNLVGRYGTPTLLTVPGFKPAQKKVVRDEREEVMYELPEVGMVGGDGYFLPIRDEEGRNAALQLRLKDGGYIAFSAPVGGSAAGLHVHVPLGFQGKDGAILVTEGIHKSEIASKHLGRLVLGLPSIAMIELAMPLFGALGVTTVELAYDADTREKPTCAAPLRRAAHRLAEAGYVVKVWTWPSAAGKGLDDVLVRPALHPEPDQRDGLSALTVLEGQAVWKWIKQVCATAKLPADPIQDALLDARVRITTILNTVEKDASFAFRPENIEAVAVLDKTSPEAIKIFDELKVALQGKWTAYQEQVDQARRKFDTKKRVVRAIAQGQQVFRTASHAEIGQKLLAAVAVDHRGQPDPKYAKFANGYLHIYEHGTGIWKPVERARLSTLIQGWDRSPVLDSKREFRADCGPISGGIKCAFDTAELKGFFDMAPTGLTFTNGFVSAHDGKLILSRHSSENRALHAYDFDHTDAGSPVAWCKALGELWEGDDDVEQKVMYLQEKMGASLMGDAPMWQKATIFWGPTSANGKSSLNAALRSIFHPTMVSSVQPQHFAEKFRLAELAGRLGNFVDELPGKYVTDSEVIKWIITAKSPITAERKNQDPFEFVPRAGHFWCCNSLPAADEMGEAFFRRFVILYFNRRFTGADDRRNYLEGIAQRERPLIVSWALNGYARLLKNGGYTIPPSSIEHTETWRKKTDQVARFVDECLVVVDSPAKEKDRLLKLDGLYSLYCTWLGNDAGKKFTLAKETLGERLKAAGYEYRTGSLRAYRLRARPLQPVRDPVADSITAADLDPPDSSQAKAIAEADALVDSV